MVKRTNRRGPVVVLILAALGGFPGTAAGFGTAPRPTDGPTEKSYKTVGGAGLRALVFSPPGLRRGDRRPAIVFFHGGGWIRGTPEMSASFCRYFAERGMVAVAPQYRLVDRRGVTPVESISDAKSAIRWVRSHADELRVDPDRVVAAGWSAGGHLAASAAMVRGFDDPTDDLAVSPVPNALVLWYPAVDLAREPAFARLLRGRARTRRASPASNVRPGLPPAIVFQGSEDRVTSARGAKRFTRRMRRAGNRCQLELYRGRRHLFTRDLDDYTDTMKKADAFLASLGILRGEPDTAAIRRSRVAGPAAPRPGDRRHAPPGRTPPPSPGIPPR